jgi:hypothetical protein
MQRLALLCFLALSLMWPHPGFAHGGGVPQITDAPAGPYRLFAWSNPDPWRTGGTVHLTVAVTMMDANGQIMPISDATVTVMLTAQSQPASEVQWVATPNPTAAGFYEADGELPVAGVWRVEVLVSGAAGTGSGVFTTTAQPGSSLNWVIWASAGVGVLVLVGFFATRQRSVHANAPHAQRA